MAFTNSTNMGLPIPGVGTEAGPAYATDINNALTLIDQHNHTPGYGVPVPVSGLNINSALSMQSNFLTNVAGVTYITQTATPANYTAYNKGVDLYFVDGNGNNIQITASGGIAGSPGSISGLSSPASATYVSGSKTFVWQSNTSIAANLDAASVLFRNITPNSTFAITVQAPAALASNWSLTLPSIPASTKFLTLDTSGNISTASSISGAQIAALSITGSQLANNTITATQIAGGTITNVEISSSAAIIGTQLNASANILGSQLQSGTITNVQISPTAAIIGTQLNSTANILGSQLITNPNFNGTATQIASKYVAVAGANGTAGLAIYCGSIDLGAGSVSGTGVSVTSTGATTVGITYANAFASTPFVVVSNSSASSNFQYLSSSTTTDFTLTTSAARNGQVNFIAIGVRPG